MGAAKRLATSMLLAVLLTGCTYSAHEPGLFATKGPSRSNPPPRTPDPPGPTPADLPVAGEAVWTTGDGVQATVRFAVHAVRRIPGGTVLDWSVTPLSAPGRRLGDALPTQLDLGMSAAFASDANISLLDPGRGALYPPMRHRSRQLFNHCLCTPLWSAQQHLRVGETHLLQITFPELPAGTAFVDVVLPNVAPFSHVPVSPVGTAPVAARGTDLTRPAEKQPTAGDAVRIRYPRLNQAQTVQVNRVVAGPSWTTMEWTIHSVTDQSRLQAYGPPVSSDRPPGPFILSDIPTDGPQLHNGATTLTAGWTRSRRFGVDAYICRCSNLGLWSRALTRAGGSVSVTTTYPRLPASTTHVGVVLPGSGIATNVRVTRARDSATQLRTSVPRPTGTWHYAIEAPPTGWSAQRWPTDVPDSEQLVDYTGDSYQLVDRPVSE